MPKQSNITSQLTREEEIQHIETSQPKKLLRRWCTPSFSIYRTRWHKRKEDPRSTSTPCLNIKIPNETSQPTTQLKRARRSRSFSFIPLTTLKEGTEASEHLLLPSRHSEHSERGEPSDSELSQHASLTSWNERSIDKWQLNATRPISLDQLCPMTSIARFPTLCSYLSKEEASSHPAHSTPLLLHTGLFWAAIPPP